MSYADYYEGLTEEDFSDEEVDEDRFADEKRDEQQTRIWNELDERNYNDR